MEHAKHDGAGNVLLFNVKKDVDTVPYDTSDLIHGKINFNYYRVVDSKIVPKTQEEVDVIKAALDAATTAEKERIDDIEASKSGLTEYSIEQADQWLQAQLDLTELDNAATLGEAKAAIRALIIKIYQIHLKEIPYILRPKR